MDIIAKLAEEFHIRTAQVEQTVALIDEGNTIPFIARYRKEVTGGLSDVVLRDLDERLKYLRNLEERKEEVLRLIEEQGKLTDELRKQIEEAQTLVVVDDLYRPYRPKRRTRATIAKEKGLEPLANVISLQMLKTPILEEAAKYINEEKEVHTAEEALEGAKDIIAEHISDEADYRIHIRDLTAKKGTRSFIWYPKYGQVKMLSQIIMEAKHQVCSISMRGQQRENLFPRRERETRIFWSMQC